MQHQNPYQPSTASLKAGNYADTSTRPSAEIEYAGFWRRFGAYWIDAAIFLPLTGISYLLSETTRLFYVYWFVPGLMLGLFFHVYLVKRYGGTPGKVLLKTRIALADGSAITTRAAFLRYSVLFVLTGLSSAALLSGSLAMTDELYFSLGYIAKVQKMVANAPGWYYPVSILTQIWVWSEFLSMMFNKRRRALHDFIAGTIVIRA